MTLIFRLSALVIATLVLAHCSSAPGPSSAELKAPFIDNKSEIEACYEKVLKKQPDLGSGTAELKFMINEAGQVYKTIFLKKKSTLQSKLLNACIKRAVTSWSFPTGKRIEVVYPFQFEKAGGSGSAPLSNESKASEAGKNENLDIINTTPEESGDDLEETPAE